MATLHLMLLDGFANDEVAVAVNGREVYRKAGVTTKDPLTAARADAVDVPVDGAEARLRVSVVGRADSSEQIRVVDTPFVGVRLYEGKLRFVTSAEPVPLL